MYCGISLHFKKVIRRLKRTCPGGAMLGKLFLAVAGSDENKTKIAADAAQMGPEIENRKSVLEKNIPKEETPDDKSL